MRHTHTHTYKLCYRLCGFSCGRQVNHATNARAQDKSQAPSYQPGEGERSSCRWWPRTTESPRQGLEQAAAAPRKVLPDKRRTHTARRGKEIAIVNKPIRMPKRRQQVIKNKPELSGVISVNLYGVYCAMYVYVCTYVCNICICILNKGRG